MNKALVGLLVKYTILFHNIQNHPSFNRADRLYTEAYIYLQKLEIHERLELLEFDN
jgi:hypothetical protein